MELNEGSKQYSLRWEKHAFNLATEAGCFFEDESFLDCTLSAEGRCIDAHKIILSASSSYLSSLLKLMPDKHPILIFNDIKFEQLKSLVAFIYNGSVNISESDIHAFLNAAQSLLIKGLYEEEPRDIKADHMKKGKKNNDFFDGKRTNKFYDKIPPLQKSEIVRDMTRISKKERLIMPKGNDSSNNECEDSLCKLEEISFTKYIHQNFNSNTSNRAEENKWTESSNEKTKVPEKYFVKSWKHNSIEDLNGRHKQNKSNFFKRLKLEKKNLCHAGKEVCPENNFHPGKQSDRDLNGDGCEDGIKKEDANKEMFPVAPKQEITEEEDTNSENYDKAVEPGAEMCSFETDSEFENRPDRNYFHHSSVDPGIPVPLLMCKTSLNEPDSLDSNWMSQVNNSASAEPSSQSVHHESAQDLQCRSCLQDLPCPTCTKKYKSRYALNRHILYECGKARKSFSCDECGKKVTRQDTLQKHKLIHLVQHLKDKESEAELPEPTKIKKKS